MAKRVCKETVAESICKEELTEEAQASVSGQSEMDENPWSFLSKSKRVYTDIVPDTSTEELEGWRRRQKINRSTQTEEETSEEKISRETQTDCTPRSRVKKILEQDPTPQRLTSEVKVINETNVTSYRGMTTGAPKKHTFYLCRVQIPPPESLQEEWALEDGGRWGYMFKYEVNEVIFYQLEQGESFGPLCSKATLTSTDWSVMNAAVINDLRSPVYEYELSRVKRKTLLSCTVWETKSCASGRWFYRATRQVTPEKDEFVLDYFNSECGVFRETLRLPLSAWMSMLCEKGPKLRKLFTSSQTSMDILTVKKTLSF